MRRLLQGRCPGGSGYPAGGAGLVVVSARRLMEPPAPPRNQRARVMVHGDRQRSWLAYIPAAKAERPALLLVADARGAMARNARATRFGFDVLAERHGFVVVYPDGYQRHWNDCRAGADYAANRENIDDVGFLRPCGTHGGGAGVDPAWHLPSSVRWPDGLSPAKRRPGGRNCRHVPPAYRYRGRIARPSGKRRWPPGHERDRRPG